MKKLLSSFLVASMIFAVACDNGEPSATDATTTAAPVTTTDEPDETVTTGDTEDTEDPGSQDTEDTDTQDTEGSGTEEPLEPITFTFFMGDVNASFHVQPRDIEIWDRIEEETGVNLEIEYIVGQDPDQRAALMIAGGEYPDLLLGHNSFSLYRDAGALMPINDLLDEHGQNIKDLYGNYLNRLYEDDGNIYSWTPFPMANPTDTPGSAFYLAADVLEANDWQVPETIDEYFEYIVDFYGNNPEMNGAATIGFSGPTESWRFGFMTLGGDKLEGIHNTGGYFFDPDDGYRANRKDTMEHRKDYFKHLFNLNQAGVLDPEMFSQTYDQYVAKVASGRVLGMFDEFWEIETAVNNITNNESLMGAYPVPIRIVNEGTEQDSYMGLTTVGTSNGIAITVDNKDPVRAMQFFNRMAEDDMQTLIYWGVEGEHYTINANGKLDLTDEQFDARQDPNFAGETGIAVDFLWNFPKYVRPWEEMRNGAGFPLVDYSDKAMERMYNENEQAILDNLGWETFIEPFDPVFESPYGYGYDINIPTDRDDLQDIDAAFADINTNTYYSQMVLAESEADFEAYWQELVDLQSQIDETPLLDYMTEQVNKRVTEWGD